MRGRRLSPWRHRSGPTGSTAPPHTAQIGWPSTVTRRPALRSGRTPAAPSAQRSVAAAAPPVVTLVVIVVVLALDAQHFRVVDDVAADDLQHGVDALQLLVRHGEEVLVQHDQVRELAGLDGAEIILLAHEPAVAAGVELERLLARDALVGEWASRRLVVVDRLAARVDARGGE